MRPKVDGTKISRARRAAHLTQAELAARLHRCQSTVACWEAGRRNPSDLAALAAALGVTEESLRPR